MPKYTEILNKIKKVIWIQSDSMTNEFLRKFEAMLNLDK